MADVSLMGNTRDKEHLLDTAGDQKVDASQAQLAEEIAGLFTPVRPRTDFKAELRQGLLATMRQRVLLRIARPVERRRWALIAGAAVGSLVPLVGLAAYLVRSRSTGKPHHAASH
jgi:hypothetical protein